MATFHFDLVSPEKLLFSGEVNPDGLTVLAELAVPIENFDRAALAQQIKDTEEDLADAKSDEARDKLRQRVEQLRSLQAALGH